VSEPAWLPLRAFDRLRLHEARLVAHHAVQWLARAARAFIQPKPDDSHRNFGFDHATGAFMTHSFADDLRLALMIADLRLVLVGGTSGKVGQVFRLDGKSDPDVRRWLGAQLAARGLDPTRLDQDAPYTIPDHAVARGAAYRASAMSDALAELTAWFGNADLLLGEVYRDMVERGYSASPVRCWPHHFDIATLALLDAAKGAEHGRSVNAGLSPGDEYYTEPYFYVSPYPYPNPSRLPPLPQLGHWHTTRFTAAITQASRILGTVDRRNDTATFLHAAVEAAIKSLGP